MADRIDLDDADRIVARAEGMQLGVRPDIARELIAEVRAHRERETDIDRLKREPVFALDLFEERLRATLGGDALRDALHALMVTREQLGMGERYDAAAEGQAAADLETLRQMFGSLQLEMGWESDDESYQRYTTAIDRIEKRLRGQP